MKTSSDISTRKLVIGSAAIAVLAAVIFFFAFFQVKTVEVMGNDHYSDDELKERILKSPMTSNTILAPLFYARMQQRIFRTLRTLMSDVLAEAS